MLGALRKLGRLFGGSAEPARTDRNVRLSLEPLEDRRVLAVTVNLVGTDLQVVDGDGDPDDVTLTLNVDGDLAVLENNVEIAAFDLASVNSVDFDLDGGGDTLTLDLIQRDVQALSISVDMGGGGGAAGDEVILRTNVGDGALFPSINLASDTIETIRFRGDAGDTYQTSGLLLGDFADGDDDSRNVILDGSVAISTNGGVFDASDARISASAAGIDLTIDTGAGAAHIGALNNNGGVGSHVNSLLVTSDGAVTFERINGATHVTVGSLRVEAGQITVEDSITVTSGDAHFESAGSLTFDPSAGPAQNITIDTNDGNLTLISGTTGDPGVAIVQTTFESSGGTVTFAPADNATPIQIGDPAGLDANAFQIDPAQLVDFADFDLIVIGDLDQAGTITVVDTLNLNTDVDLHLHAGAGDIVIDALVDLEGDVTVTGDGNTTTINADMMGASLTFNDDVLIGADVTLTALAGDITFDSTVDSEAGETNDLTLSAAAGNITVTGAVGALDALDVLQANSAVGVTRFNSTVQAGSLSTDLGGSTQLNGNVTTVAGQTYGDAVRIDADVVLSTTNSAVQFNNTVNSQATEANDLTVSTGTGAITFSGAVGGAVNGELGALIANSTGVTRFNSTVEAASLLTDLNGSTQLNGNVTTSGSQTYRDAVRIDSDLVLAADGDPVLFESTVDSQAGEANDLTVSAGAGAVTFSNTVGAAVTGELGALIANSTGVTRFNSTVEAASLQTNLNGSTQLNGNVTTTGSQTYGDAVRIDADVVLTTTNSPVQFNNTVNSQPAETNDLTVAAGNGDVTFTGAVGAIDRLDNLAITSADDVTFSSTLQLAGNMTQAAGTGTTTFAGTSGTGIGGLLNVTTNAVVFNTAPVVTAGTVTVTAQNGITLNAGSGINAGASTITLAANQDNVGAQGFSQNTTAVIQTTNATAAAVRIDVGGAGNAVVSTITTPQAASAGVTINANGGNIQDDGNAATRITTHDLSLSALTNIGDITSFATGAGTPIDVAVSGQLLQAAIATAGGEIFIAAQGNLTAAAAAINPAAAAAATALVTATGNLDVGTFGGVAVTPGDNLGLLAVGTLTLPAGGIDVGATGNLRLAGNVDVQDGDHALGPFVANSLDFLSGSLIATQLTTNVALLTAEMTAPTVGLTVIEQDGVTLQSVTTNSGDLLVLLTSPGNISVQSVDAGTALAALVAAPILFPADGAILDGDGAALDTVDITAGQVLLLATQGIGTDANALDIDGTTLAATTVTGDINITDLAGGLTVGSVSGFNGVQVTGGVLGDDVRLATQGAGADLVVSNVVSTAGSGAVFLSSSDDVSVTATGSITSASGAVSVDADGNVSLAAIGSIATVAGNIGVVAGNNVEFISTASVTTASGNVDVDAGGGIAMADGTQIVATAGSVDLQAVADIALSRVQANASNVIVTSTGGAITDSGDLLGANISAIQAALRAANGIGTGNPLETTVNVLSARNTSLGNIEISSVTDPAFGALLTIGTVNGLIGVVNIAPGGAVSLSNFGPINLNSTVASAGNLTITALTPTLLPVNPGNLAVNAQISAGNDLTLTAGNNLVIDDPVVDLNAQVAAAGDVLLTAGSNLVINNTGLANDVVGDTVTGNAGGTVTFGPDVIVRSTGAGAGAVADKLPAFTPLVPSVDNDPLTIAQLPLLHVLFNIGRAGEANLSVLVEFDIQDTATGTFNGANLNAQLDGTIIDAGAGFFIRITVTDAPGITFSEAGTVLALPPVTFLFQPIFVPMNIDLPRAEPIAAALLDPTPPTTFVALNVPIQQQNTFTELQAVPDAPQSADVRIIVVEKIGPDNQVEQDRTDRPIVREYVDTEAEAILENPSKLFEQLKSGRFRIWLKDGMDAPRNLIWDIILRDGRPQSGGEGTERPPTEIPGDAQDDGMPGAEAAPAAKVMETAVRAATAPDVHTTASVDRAAGATPDLALPATAVVPEASSADVDQQQESTEQSGTSSATTEVLHRPASQQPLTDNAWRHARRIDSGLTSTLRSNSP